MIDATLVLRFSYIYIYVIYKYWSGTVLLFRFQGWLVLRRDWVPVSDLRVFSGYLNSIRDFFRYAKKNWAGTILGQGLSPQPLKVYTIRLFFYMIILFDAWDLNYIMQPENLGMERGSLDFPPFLLRAAGLFKFNYYQPGCLFLITSGYDQYKHIYGNSYSFMVTDLLYLFVTL